MGKVEILVVSRKEQVREKRQRGAKITLNPSGRTERGPKTCHACGLCKKPDKFRTCPNPKESLIKKPIISKKRN